MICVILVCISLVSYVNEYGMIVQGGPKVTSQRFELIARPLII